MYKPWLATVKPCFFCEGLLDNSRNMFNTNFDFGVNWYFINWDQKCRVWGSKLCFHDSFVLFHINPTKFAQYFCCSPQDTFVMKKEPGVSSTRVKFLREHSRGKSIWFVLPLKLWRFQLGTQLFFPDTFWDFRNCPRIGKVKGFE